MVNILQHYKISKTFNDFKKIDSDKFFHNAKELLKIYREVKEIISNSIDDLKTEYTILELMLQRGEVDKTHYNSAINILKKRENDIEINKIILKMMEDKLIIIRDSKKTNPEYYWILYYSYIEESQEDTSLTAENIIDRMKVNNGIHISRRKFFYIKKEAIEKFGVYLFGLTSYDYLPIVNNLIDSYKSAKLKRELSNYIPMRK